METVTVDYLSAALPHDDIMRMPLHGSKDYGDIAGVKCISGKVCIECKNHRKLDLAGWYGEAEAERGNSDAAVAVVVHKRHGKGRPGDQWVTMTLRDLALLLGGEPA